MACAAAAVVLGAIAMACGGNLASMGTSSRSYGFHFDAKALAELTWLRNHIGLKMSFLEDPLLEGMLAARANRGTRNKIKTMIFQERRARSRRQAIDVTQSDLGVGCPTYATACEPRWQGDDRHPQGQDQRTALGHHRFQQGEAWATKSARQGAPADQGQDYRVGVNHHAQDGFENAARAFSHGTPTAA